MKIFSSALCLLVLALTVESCQKKSDPEPQPTKTDNLSASAWKVNEAGVDLDKNGVIDQSVLNMIPACTADNTITFKRDNSGVTDEGTLKCLTTDPQTTAFNWSFADAEANINISNSVLTQINGKSKILELNATALSLSKDTTIGGFSAALVVKLKH